MFPGRRSLHGDCPILKIPAWYWSMLDIGAAIERGAVPLDGIDRRTYETARAVWSQHGHAKVAQAEHEQKKKDMLRGVK